MLCGICTLSCLLSPAVMWRCVVTFRSLQANACLLWATDPQVVCTPNQLLLGCAGWQWPSLQALYHTHMLRTGCKVTLTVAHNLGLHWACVTGKLACLNSMRSCQLQRTTLPANCR